MGLSDIVNVTISRTTRSISRAGFGVPLVLGSNANFGVGEVFRAYSSAKDVLADFASNTQEYLWALRLFGQANKPSQILIGKRGALVAQVETITPTPVNGAIYTVTVNGVDYSFTADTDATAAEIVAGLKAALAGVAAIVASGTTTLILTAAAAGVGFSLGVTSNLAVAHTTPSHGVVEDIAAIDLKNDTWYCLILTSRLKADILAAASVIESQRRLFLAATADADVVSSSTTDVASVLKALGYARTATFFSNDQANGPEAALAGARLPLDPGSETWRYAQLVGVAPEALSTTQENYLKSKNVNFLETVAGVNVVNGGKVAVGEWIDTIRFCDWFQAQIEEGCFARLIGVPKIPYTDAGATVFEEVIRNVQKAGIRVGGLASDPAPTVTVPKVSDQSDQDRQDRFFPGIEFDGRLAGAIHELDINGNLSA